MRRNDQGDAKKQLFRSNDRFFQINGQWYFSAREGEIGPFRTRQQAKREAEAYIAVRQAQSGVPKPKHLRVAETTVIPGYVYRSVISMQQRATSDRDLTLEID